MSVKKFKEFVNENENDNSDWENIHPDEMMAPFEHCECKDKEIVKRGDSYFCEKCGKIIYVDHSKIEGDN